MLRALILRVRLQQIAAQWAQQQHGVQMDKQEKTSAGESLVAERERIEKTQPQLANGYEAFRQSYALYEKMTSQFDPKAGSVVIAAAGVFRSA
jgi:hypothetical protein